MEIFETILQSLIFWKLGFFISIVISLCGLQWWRNVKDYIQQQIKIIKLARSLPGPPTLPLVGNSLELWESDQTINTLTSIARKLNTSHFRFWLGPTVKFVTSDPDDYEIILKSANAANKAPLYQCIKPAVTTGFFNMPYGPMYRSHKKTVFPVINCGSIFTLHIAEFNKQSRQLVHCLEKNVDAGDFEVHDYLQCCLSDIVAETIVGYPGRAQYGDVHPILNYIEEMLHLVYKRMVRPWLYSDLLFFFTSNGRRFKEVIQQVNCIVDELITERQNKMKSPDFCKVPVVDFFIDQYKIKSDAWGREELRSEIITFFVASYDTLLGICCFTVLMIAMHPEVQKNIKEELDSIVKQEDIAEEEVKDLKYLEMVIRETVRLFPAGPLIGRKTTGDIQLNTVTVPKGCDIWMLLHATHRDPRHWVEPEKFIPERFRPENSKDRHSFAYLPFSSGLRICPGSKYAIHCIKIIVAHLVRSYELSTTMKFDKLRINAHISTRSQDGYRISLTKR